MKLSLFLAVGFMTKMVSCSLLKGSLRKVQEVVQVVQIESPPAEAVFDPYEVDDYDFEEAHKKNEDKKVEADEIKGSTKDKGKDKKDKDNESTPLELQDGECAVCTPDNKIRPSSLTLRYWGGDGAISRFQDSEKADCRIQAFPNETTISIYGINYEVTNGTEFTFSPPEGDKMDAFTFFTFADGSECFIHTSCSQPIVAGDRLGPFEIVPGKNTCLGESNPSEAETDENGECVVCDPDNKIRPTAITFKYIGGIGKISNYQTIDKADCRDQTFPDSTNITIKGYDLVYEVFNNTEFTYAPPDGKKMDAFTYFVFPDGSECFIHTSCSQPLVAGDQMGPFKLMAAANENNCVYIEPTVSPTVSPTLSPTPCECQALAEWDNGVVTIDFKYCDAEPNEFDWIGIYPCDSETMVADEEWNDRVPFDDVFEIGYVLNETYVNAPHAWWGYTCGSPDDGCQRNPNTIWPSQGTIVINPGQAGSRYDPRSGYWAFPAGPTLTPGCYRTMLNRVSRISAPPYPTVCKEWALGDDFTVPSVP